MGTFESFRRQEIALVKLNLSAIAALTLVHLAFGRWLGFPNLLSFVLLSGRFVEQAVEWHLLRVRSRPITENGIRIYSFVSPLAAILFAFIMMALSSLEDAHYHVLMVIPIISVAYRFKLRWVLGFIAAAGTLTVLGVIIVKDVDDVDGIKELFEAVTVVLIYLVVGIVVWMLSEHLRRDSAELKLYYANLQAMQAQLSKDERLAAVGRLASAVAHEIRNPVAAISSSLAVAEDDSMPAALRSEMSRIAAKEAGRLEKLTTDFLSYARNKPLELRPTEVADAVKYVADLLAAKAAAHSVSITTSCNQNLQATMDEFQIHGALLNLAMNAIEASPAGARVEIGFRLKGDGAAEKFVEIYVQNSGDPIPAEVADRIFEPFFTNKASGTGLGLAIARNVAIAHGGKLELTDNRAGHIRFTLSIPYHADVMLPSKPSANHSPQSFLIDHRALASLEIP